MTLERLRQAKKPDGTPVFPCLWNECACIRPENRRSCDRCLVAAHDDGCIWCHGTGGEAYHYRDPLEAVGPVLKDFYEAAKSQAFEYAIWEMWRLDPRECFANIATLCVALGWLQPEQEAEDAG